MTEPSSNVRVRGIYATALTRTLLDAGHTVVQASPPIQRRFDADLPAADHDAAIETGPDRQGVNVAGDSETVDAIRELLVDTGIDTLAWADPAPVGAVFDGRVTETLGSGAVVALGETTGYLPFRAVDGRVDEGDTVRVQVTEAAAPWDDDRPLLDTGLRVDAGLATLTRGRDGVRVAESVGQRLVAVERGHRDRHGPEFPAGEMSEGRLDALAGDDADAVTRFDTLCVECVRETTRAFVDIRVGVGLVRRGVHECRPFSGGR